MATKKTWLQKLNAKITGIRTTLMMMIATGIAWLEKLQGIAKDAFDTVEPIVNADNAIGVTFGTILVALKQLPDIWKRLRSVFE